MVIKFILIGFGMALGDVLMKSWANNQYSLQGNSLLFLGGAILTYAASLTYYGLQLRVTNFSVATILPIIINVLIILLITIFYYHEPLSFKQWVGALLGMCAVVLLN